MLDLCIVVVVCQLTTLVSSILVVARVRVLSGSLFISRIVVMFLGHTCNVSGAHV